MDDGPGEEDKVFFKAALQRLHNKGYGVAITQRYSFALSHNA
jgi:hypothetical protein